MALRNLLIIALVLVVAPSNAFTPPPVGRSSYVRSTTAIGFFGFLFGDNSEEPAKAAKTAPTKGGKKKEEEPKKPFIFLYGKPQYDWVKNKPRTTKAKGEYTWAQPVTKKTTKKGK
jgi:hypothetical protein